MRLVVIGEVYPQPDSTLKGQAWFRYPVAAGRQTLYAAEQADYHPQAPGDYLAADSDEVALFQKGEYVERLVGADARFDPAAGDTIMQAQIARLYQLAAAHFAASEDERLQFYGSSFDGRTWAMRFA